MKRVLKNELRQLMQAAPPLPGGVGNGGKQPLQTPPPKAEICS